MVREKEGLKPSQELAIRTDYEKQRGYLEALAGSISRACEAVLTCNDVPYHSVKARVKSLPSSLDKIVRKRYEPSLQQVEDLVGIRVICLYPRHIDPIVSLLEHEFTVLEKVDKRPAPGTTQFGYSSVHLICTLMNTPRANLPEHTGMQDMRFEIQVRTILQEAWAEIEHGLIYKSEGSAPEEIRRQIARVSAVLEMADEDFQRVYDLRETYVQKLKETDLKELSDEPLNADSLMEVIERKLPWAVGWKEIHKHRLTSDVATLLFHMQELDVTKVQQLVFLIDKWHDAEYEESKKGYLITSGQKEPATEEERTYTAKWENDLSRKWHERAKQYFLPIGFIRGVLMYEFPDYKARLEGGRYA